MTYQFPNGRGQAMSLQKRNIPVIFSTVILVLWVAAWITFADAEETKTIPDHTNFTSCKACHAEKRKMWEESNHGKAIRQTVHNNTGATDCSGCHASETSESLQQKAATDSQESHHKEACLACHSRQQAESQKRLVMDPQKLCTTCHFQSSVFLGLGAKGIEDSRNFHSGVLCYTCHMTEKNHDMKVIRPDDPGLTGKRQDTCTACHMDNNREARVKQIQEWQSTYNENMPPLLADVKTIEEALSKNPRLLKASLKSKFDDVKANLALLEKDGSHGFHNFVFMLEITSMAKTDLKIIKAAIKK
jgi:predicted CXXCH cytochrome family protein